MSKEILIIGAGYVGCTLAILLKRAGIPVMLLEKSPEDIPIPDDRHFGIARESRHLLQKLGFWAELHPHITDIAAMQIDTAQTTILRLGQKDDIIGRTLPAALLHQTLRRAVHEADIPVLFDCHVTELVHHDHCSRVSTNTGALITTPLVVAADGMHSGTRELAGITLKIKDYHQNAQQWRMTHSQSHGQQAFEILLPEGPYALLPTQDTHCSKLIWCTNTDTKPEEADILRYFPAQLGEVEMLEYIGAYPLVLQQAKEAYRDRVVLIGDAYQRVHPVAAQGLNIGLRDSEALSDMVINAVRLGLDMGSTQFLQRFAASRRLDRFMVRGLTDFLGHRAGTPLLEKPLGIFSKLLATQPAKHAIRAAFHGE